MGGEVGDAAVSMPFVAFAGVTGSVAVACTREGDNDSARAIEAEGPAIAADTDEGTDGDSTLSVGTMIDRDAAA